MAVKVLKQSPCSACQWLVIRTAFGDTLNQYFDKRNEQLDFNSLSTAQSLRRTDFDIVITMNVTEFVDSEHYDIRFITS